ncbi:MAG: MATE family efflux transporter [Bacteroidales bacterium]
MPKLTTGHVGKRIFYFTWPLLLGNAFQQLYHVVDSIIVGKYLGKAALAGVIASSQVLMIIVSLAIGIGIGGSVVISQFFGARSHQKVQETSDTLTLFMLFTSVFFSAIGFLFSEPLLQWIQLPVEAMEDGVTYLHVLFAGLITMFGYNAASSILRGIGDSKTPLYALIIATLTNIILDIVFVLGCNMGVEGVALATVLSQTISWGFLILHVQQQSNFLSFNVFRAKFIPSIFKSCLSIGLPSGIQQTLGAIGMTALFGIINTFGVDVAAGYGAATRIDMFIGLPAMNFAAALSTFVGQNIGAGNSVRIKEGLRFTLLMSGVISLAVTLLVMLLREPLIGLFTNASNHEVIRVGAEYLMIVCSFYILFSTLFVLTGLFRGAGASFMPMLITLVGLWLVRLPVAYWLSSTELGYQGIFWAVPIAWAVGLIIAIWYYLSGKWKNKSVVKTR